MDKITPKTGVVEPNIDTFETLLYLRSTPHRVYAMADTRAR